MRIAIEVDQQAFLRPKSKEDLEREVLEAATIYWLARRDIDPKQIRPVANPVHRDLIDVLLSPPAAGDDQDFQRVQASSERA